MPAMAEQPSQKKKKTSLHKQRVHVWKPDMDTLHVSLPFLFIMSLLRGEFKNDVFCCPQGNPLITVIQVLLKLVNTMWNRSLFDMQGSALWTRISHVTAGKVLRGPQTNCTPDGQRGSPLLPKLNEMHIYVYVLSLWLLIAVASFTLRVARGLRRESFSASAGQPRGILVETGNSVDYSLAIRLLSLRWLSLLHHEIAWLSVRLESVLCSNLPPSLLTPLWLRPSSYSPHLKEGKRKEFIWLPSGQRSSARARRVDWLYSTYYLISIDHCLTPVFFF